MTTLARKLKARGHDVVFLSMPDTERFVRAAELPFIPFCENDFPVNLSPKPPVSPQVLPLPNMRSMQ